MTDLERARELMRNFTFAEARAAGGEDVVRRTALTDALAAARREGAEEMRERAAKIAARMFGEDHDEDQIADAIRALPIGAE